MYKLGSKSLKELEGVHPDLVSVVKRTMELTPVDFSVHDGIRSAADQRQMFRKGASQLDGTTKKSKHQKQKDGWGHAVDLVPYYDGALHWEWEPLYDIAAAVAQAANELGVRIRWGGSWGEITNTTTLPRALNQEYVERRLKAGSKAFTDGPHFELLL